MQAPTCLLLSLLLLAIRVPVHAQGAPNGPVRIRELLDQTKKLLVAREDRQAIEILERTCLPGKNTLSPGSQDSVECLNYLGTAKQHLLEYAAAEVVFRYALKELDAHHRPDIDIQRADITGNLAITLKKQAKYEDAISAYRQSIDIRKKLSGTPRLILNYTNLANLYHDTGRFEDWKTTLLETLKVAEQTASVTDSERAQLMNNVGIMFLESGQLEAAESLLQKSLELRTKILPIDHIDLGQSFNNLGQVYSDLGNYDKSELYYQKSIEIYNKKFPPGLQKGGTVCEIAERISCNYF
jgi:tetratricopeptide (TPR) repeat protein